MHLTNEQIQDVLGVLAGILHLGNVSFVQAGGAQVADKAGAVPYIHTEMITHSIQHTYVSLLVCILLQWWNVLQTC